MSVEVTTTSGNTVTATVSGGTDVTFSTTSTSVSVTAPSSSSISVSEKGPKGDTGVTGATGSTGATGATGAAGPTYSVSCVDGDNSDEEKIRLTGSDSSTDDVVLEAGTGLSIARSGDKITFTNTVSDTDTNTQNTTTLSFVDSSDDILLRNTTGGAGSGTDDIKFVAGSNVTLTHTDADNITIASTDTNTQLSTEQVQDIAGPLVATGGTKTNIAVTYDDTNGDIDFVVASDLNTTGNAGTATALATARAINGVDFDGTAPITVTAAGSTLSDTVTVAKGGTGLTTVAANTILTGNGTSALTSESNLTFNSDRLIIGADAEITPQLRFVNDENTVNLAIADSADNVLSGSVDGDFIINSTGDHNLLFGQNNAVAAKIDTDGNFNLNRRFTVTGDTDGTFEGDVVYFGGTTSMTLGRIYHYKSDGTWEAANASTVATSDGLLAVALGAASDTNGMLLRGMVTLDHDAGAVGDVLFINTAGNGGATSTAPSSNNNIVRVIGYCLHASNGQIWFNPDNTFVEVTA